LCSKEFEIFLHEFHFIGVKRGSLILGNMIHFIRVKRGSLILKNMIVKEVLYQTASYEELSDATSS